VNEKPKRRETASQSVAALTALARELRELGKILQTGFEWQKVHANLATKHDLQEMEKRIMAKVEDLIKAATELSTASDAVSLRLDNLITKIDAFIAAVPTADLSPEGEAALAALRTSRDSAVAGGDKVDAEVTKLDGLLPTPAPAGQI